MRKRFDGEAEPQEEPKPYRWIDDDCRVVECNAGLISVEIESYTTAFRCPECDRWPNPVKPAVYQGRVTYRTAEEMHARREERKERYFERRRAVERSAERIGTL